MGWWGGETLEEGGASDRVNGNENWGRVHGGRVNGRHQMVSQRDSGNSGGISLSVFEAHSYEIPWSKASQGGGENLLRETLQVIVNF